MKTGKLITALVAAMIVAAVSTPAQARRSERYGFNFGTSVRLLSSDDRTFAIDTEEKNTQVTGKSQAVNPYIGYSFGAMNLGLVFSVEQKETNTIERSTDGLHINEYTTDISQKGTGVFARFLFGGVFYFEAALGLYSEKVKTLAEYTVDTGSGTFSGQAEERIVQGVGPGYHLAGGIELPISNGFYFTTAYLVRIVQLREHDGGTEFGDKRAREQKREVMFGLAHYYSD